MKDVKTTITETIEDRIIFEEIYSNSPIKISTSEQKIKICKKKLILNRHPSLWQLRHRKDLPR